MIWGTDHIDFVGEVFCERNGETGTLGKKSEQLGGPKVAKMLLANPKSCRNESRKARLSRWRVRSTVQPVDHTDEIHGGGGRNVLQPRLCQATVAAASHCQRLHRLRDCPFDTGAFHILLLERVCLLPQARALQSLVLRLHEDVNLTGFSFRTTRFGLTGAAGVFTKEEANGIAAANVDIRLRT